MKKETGVWIDHTQAVVVMGMNLDDTEEIIRIISGIVTHDRFSGASHASVARSPHTAITEYGRARHFDNLLNRYYDKIILHLRDATSLVIIGPGDAKYEFQKRLDIHGLSDRIVAIQTADQMSDERIAVEVR